MPPNNELLAYLQGINPQQQAPEDNESTGVSDDIPAMLSEGEYVVNAEQVSKFGGGATEPGLRFLEQLFEMVNTMDRDTAASFADNTLIMAELLLDEQPSIAEE